MNKDSIKKNYIYNISYQIFVAMVPLITTPYISRILGIDGIGINSYTYSMVRYFWLLSALGTATYGIRIIGISQEDREKRTFEFWNLLALKFILSSICIIVYLIYIVMIAEYKKMALVQGIYLVAVATDITWFYQGMENFKKVTIKNFIVKILNVIYIFAFIKESSDLLKYAIGLAGFQLLGNLSLWFSLRKYVNLPKGIKLKPLDYLKPSSELFIPSVATQIFSIIDKTMIGWITGDPKENGYYEQAIKVIDVSLVIITTLGTVMIPSIARNYENNEKRAITNALNKSFRFTFFLSIPMIIGVFLISDKFVPMFFGEEYKKSAVILKVLSLMYLFMGINSITGTQYLISTGQQNKHTKFLLIGGTINIILNYILIHKILSLGAAIASVIGEFIVTLLEVIYLKNTKQYDLLKNIKIVKNYLISGILMGVIIFLLIRFVNNFINLIILILVAMVVYIITLILLNDQFTIEQIKKTIKKGTNIIR